MYKVLTGVLGAVFLVAGAMAADENGIRVGVVNVPRLIEASPQGELLRKRIEKEFKQRDQDLKKMDEQVRTLQETLNNDKALSDADRKAKTLEFDELSRKLQRGKREFTEDLNERQNREMTAIYDSANRAIKRVAEAEKYDLILQDAAYVNPRVDLTDKVIKAMKDIDK
jgi:outer membrane protein